MLQYIQAHPKRVVMKERNDKLILRFEQVTKVKEAINKLSAVL
jgi:NifB/MoaA-like Fe-S oxidoreductase